MSDDTRTLVAVIALGICNHVVLAGTRVTVALTALAEGESAAVVGALLALFAFVPMLIGVLVGRFADRVGVRKPMLAGSIGIGIGAALPFAQPGLPSLFVAATLIGGSFTLFQVATQKATGDLGAPTQRARNFSLLALGYSTSLFAGPLVAGFAIDHIGNTRTFGVLALVALVPIAVLATGKLALPRAQRSGGGAAFSGMLELLRHAKLRRLLAINALFAIGWDLQSIFVPVYGNQIGLTASQIGMVLSAFATATFVVRFAMPAIARRVSEVRVLAAALLVAGGAFLAFPFATSGTALAAVCFVTGLGLGGGQPMVMSLLHAHAPAGRMGEAAGLRMSLINALGFAVPLVFGAAGGAIGIAPVLWAVGLGLMAGGYLTRRVR